MKHMQPAELKTLLAAGSPPVMLDIRESWEHQLARIENSRWIPMGEIPARFGELDPQAETVVICHHGGRSMQVAMFLERQGFSRIFNLTGGVNAWARTVDPPVPLY